MSVILDIAPSMHYIVCVNNTSAQTFGLANRLKVARAEHGLSQDELARMAGVTRQTISSIETGQYCPSALLAFLLARVLERPVAELFFLEPKGDVK